MSQIKRLLLLTLFSQLFQKPKQQDFLFQFCSYSYMSANKSRNWSEKEDQDLLAVLDEIKDKNGKQTWNEIAEKMKQRNPESRKTGKQCRQRWANQLDPNIKRNEIWSQEENEILFSLHEQLGNKWSQISNKIPGRTDNCVKNHFYSTMRRGLRKMNSYIENIKRKKSLAKTFKIQILNKVLAICEGKNDSRYQFNDSAKKLAFSIKSNIVKLTLHMSDADEENADFKQKLFQEICEFSRNCRKKKMKKSSDYSQQQVSVANEKEFEKGDNLVEASQEESAQQKEANNCEQNNNVDFQVKKVPLIHVSKHCESMNYELEVSDQKKQKVKHVDSSQILEMTYPMISPFPFHQGFPQDYFYSNSRTQEGIPMMRKNSSGILQNSFLNSIQDMSMNKFLRCSQDKSNSGVVTFMSACEEHQVAEKPINFQQIIKSQDFNGTIFRESTLEGSGLFSSYASYSPQTIPMQQFAFGQPHLLRVTDESFGNVSNHEGFSGRASGREKQQRQGRTQSFRLIRGQRSYDFSRDKLNQ